MEDLSASTAIINKNNIWIPDDMVTHCTMCRARFGFFLRKHHCRACGQIFCAKCCYKFTDIPNFIKDRPEPEDYWNPSHYIPNYLLNYIPGLKGESERVCNTCFSTIENKKIAYERITQILNNPVDIVKIMELPDSQIDVKNHYCEYFRNIQYYLPNHTYCDIDKNFLSVNAHYFSGHSKYLVHLIKSIDWDNYTDLHQKNAVTERIISIINGEKIINCPELLCTRTCATQMSLDDCVNILYSTNKDLPEALIDYLFELINLSPDDVIICHMTFFVTMVKNHSNNPIICKHLYHLLSRSIKIIYHAYWFLNNALENANLQQIANINAFLDLYDPKLRKSMFQTYSFYVGLIKNLDDPVRYLSINFNNHKPICLPYEPSKKLVEVDLENIVSKSSSTHPIVIPFKIREFDDNGEPIDNMPTDIKLLFKKESIMNDVTVLNLMILSDFILSENLGVNFPTVIYSAMPLTANSGMIQIIEQAKTIHEITKEGKSIFQYIVAKNEECCGKDILDRYMYSLVSYTLHSYFFGLGDRHLQNIMITDDGIIFHIDFGFILGKDAHFLSATNIKLNSNMLDVIGGSGGDRYKKYLELATNGVLILRKYFNTFFILLTQETNCSIKHVEKFVLSRFQPRQSDKEIEQELVSIIDQSCDTYKEYIRDFLHHHHQEKLLNKAFRTIFGTIGRLGNSH